MKNPISSSPYVTRTFALVTITPEVNMVKAVKIEGIKKVKLQVTIEIPHSLKDNQPPPLNVAFIYGIGARGLTPFEYMLTGMSVGDHVSFELKPPDAPIILGHLVSDFAYLVFQPHPGLIKATVTDVIDADDHEIVKAMAASTGCGSSCCGDHH